MSDRRKYKILFIGDYSNLQHLLGKTLRKQGHDVTVMSEGCGFQNTFRDVDINRRRGKIHGALLAAKLWGPWHKVLKDNDIVVLQNPHFLPLRPSRIKYFFDRLRGENRSVFLSAAGTDEYYLRDSLDPTFPLRYNEWRVGDRPAPYAIEQPGLIESWLTPEMMKFADYVYSNIDGAVSALYEYHLTIERALGKENVAYGGIPIDTGEIKYRVPSTGGPLKLFLGRHLKRYAEKGTDILEHAALEAIGKFGEDKVRLEIVENRPYEEYVSTMIGSHIMLDQIYSYTPATNALIGMARGLTAVSGGEPEYYDFIGEKELRPIVNASPDAAEVTRTMIETVEKYLENPGSLEANARASREFVERHNEANLVADRYLKFWESKLR